MSKSKGKPSAIAVQRPIAEVTKPGESHEAMVARTLLRPTLNAALIVSQFSRVPDNVDVQLSDLVNELSAQCDAVSRGDLERAEATLMAQAHALNAIFTKLACLASSNIPDHFDAADRLMRLALKAQSQCRATLETLSAIKNPPVVIARQANLTTGPQQVNNGVAQEIQTKPNELLEQVNGERVDGRAADQTAGANQTMETVGAINGSKVE